MPGALLNPQSKLDDAFGTSAEARQELAAGGVPHQLAEVVRRMSRSGHGGEVFALLLLPVLVGLTLGMSSGSRPASAIVPAVALAVVLGWLALSRARWLLHCRRVFRARGRVRTIHGEARTVRSWNYGYGETYHLAVDILVAGET